MSHITVSVFFFSPFMNPHTSTPEQIPQHSPFPQVVFRKITNTYIYMCIHRQAYTCVHIICTSTHKHHSHKKRGEKKEKKKKKTKGEREKKKKGKELQRTKAPHKLNPHSVVLEMSSKIY